MKNLANYLDNYVDESCCGNKKQSLKDKTNKEALKAYKRMSREDEIERHGRPINYNKVERSKKLYTRKEKHKKIY